MASSGEIIFDWAVGFVDECAAADVELPPQLTRLLPYVDVVLWARMHRTLPTWQQISDRWNVGRATAFRWRRVLLAHPQEQPAALLPNQLPPEGWYQSITKGPTR